MINFYQKYLSPLYHSLGRNLFGSTFACRFTPSCSEYSKQSFAKYSFFKALFLSVFRLLRCNPLFKGGYDPV